MPTALPALLQHLGEAWPLAMVLIVLLTLLVSLAPLVYLALVVHLQVPALHLPQAKADCVS